MPRQSNSLDALPPPALDALRELGARLRARRLAANMTIAQAAERLLCSVGTYRALEAGKPGVSLGLLAHALWLFDRVDDLAQLSPVDIGMLQHKRSQRARPSAQGIRDDERDF